jgi:glutaminase
VSGAGLVPGDSQTQTGSFIQNGFSRFAGRALQLDEPMYASELATNRRNLGIANLLEEQGCIWFDPEASSELDTRQCALKVSCHDLAVMAATGLDETFGDWIVAIGLPGKSGVSGGLISATPAREAWPPTPPRSMPLATACAANSPPRFCPSAWGCICWHRSRSLPSKMTQSTLQDRLGSEARGCRAKHNLIPKQALDHLSHQPGGPGGDKASSWLRQ